MLHVHIYVLFITRAWAYLILAGNFILTLGSSANELVNLDQEQGGERERRGREKGGRDEGVLQHYSGGFNFWNLQTAHLSLIISCSHS